MSNLNNIFYSFLEDQDIVSHYELFVRSILKYCEHLYDHLKKKLNVPQLKKRYCNTLYFFEFYYDEVFSRLNKQIEICSSENSSYNETQAQEVDREEQYASTGKYFGENIKEETEDELEVKEKEKEKEGEDEDMRKRKNMYIVPKVINDLFEESRQDVRHVYEFLLTVKLILACDDRLKRNQKNVSVNNTERETICASSPTNEVSDSKCRSHEDVKILYRHNENRVNDIDKKWPQPIKDVQNKKLLKNLLLSEENQTKKKVIQIVKEREEEVLTESDMSEEMQTYAPEDVQENVQENVQEQDSEINEDTEKMLKLVYKNETDSDSGSAEDYYYDECYESDEYSGSDGNSEMYCDKPILKYDVGILVTLNSKLVENEGLAAYMYQAHHHITLKCLQTYFYRINLKKCISRMIKDIKIEPNLKEELAELYYHKHLIKKCRPNYTLETCEMLFKEFSFLYKEQKKRNPVVDITRNRYFELISAKTEYEKNKLAKATRKELIFLLKSLLKWITKLDKIDIFLLCEKYVNRHIIRKNKSRHFGSKHPLLKCFNKIISYYNAFVLHTTAKYKIIKYFDYDFDKILTKCSKILSFNVQQMCLYYQKMKTIDRGRESNECLIKGDLNVLFKREKYDNEISLRYFEKNEFVKTLYLLKRCLLLNDLHATSQNDSNNELLEIEEKDKKDWLDQLNFELQDGEWKNVFEDFPCNKSKSIYSEYISSSKIPDFVYCAYSSDSDVKRSNVAVCSETPKVCSQSSISVHSDISAESINDDNDNDDSFIANDPTTNVVFKNCVKESNGLSSFSSSQRDSYILENHEESTIEVAGTVKPINCKNSQADYGNAIYGYGEYSGDELEFNEYDVEDNTDSFENEPYEEERLLEQYNKGVLCKANEHMKKASVKMFKYVLNHQILLTHLLTETYRNGLKTVIEKFIKKLDFLHPLNENYAEVYYYARKIESFYEVLSFRCCKEMYTFFKKKYNEKNPLLENARNDLFLKMNITNEKKKNTKTKEIRNIIKSFAQSLYVTLVEKLFGNYTPKDVNDYFVKAVMDNSTSNFDSSHPHIESLYNIIDKYNSLIKCIKSNYQFIIYYDYEIDNFLRENSNRITRYMAAICHGYKYMHKIGLNKFIEEELINESIIKMFPKRRCPENTLKVFHNTHIMFTNLLKEGHTLKDVARGFLVKEHYSHEEEADECLEKMLENVSKEMKILQLQNYNTSRSSINDEFLEKPYSPVHDDIKEINAPTTGFSRECDDKIRDQRIKTKSIVEKNVSNRSESIYNKKHLNEEYNNNISRRCNSYTGKCNGNNEEKKKEKEKEKEKESENIIGLMYPIENGSNKAILPFSESYKSCSKIKEKPYVKYSSNSIKGKENEANKHYFKKDKINVDDIYADADIDEDDVQSETTDEDITPYELCLLKKKRKENCKYDNEPNEKNCTRNKINKLDKRRKIGDYSDDEKDAESVA